LGWAMEKWPAFFGVTVEEDTDPKSTPAPAAPAS
jgi:hypothetical protein